MNVKVKAKKGRPKITDCTKKIKLDFRVTGCVIEKWGGKEKAKREAMWHLEKGPDELPKIK